MLKIHCGGWGRKEQIKGEKVKKKLGPLIRDDGVLDQGGEMWLDSGVLNNRLTNIAYQTDVQRWQMITPKAST